MTMFYSGRDERYLEEQRLRRIIREELDARREPPVPPGFIRNLDGSLVLSDNAMVGTKGSV